MQSAIVALAWFSLSILLWSCRASPDSMSFSHFLHCSFMMVVTFLGAYRFYYWVAQDQWVRKNTSSTPFRAWCAPTTWVDWYLRFSSPWVYIYSFVFYLLVGLILVVVRTREEMMDVLVRATWMALAHCMLWMFVPTTIPQSLIDLKEQHREKLIAGTHPRSFSLMCLSKIQEYDGQNTNAVPSLHCAIATFCALLFYCEYEFKLPNALLLVFLVAFSCIKTKQHLFLDCCAGIATGSFLYVIL